MKDRCTIQIQFIREGYFKATPLLPPYIVPVAIPTNTGVRERSVITIAAFPLLTWKIRLYQTRDRRDKDQMDIIALLTKVLIIVAFVNFGDFVQDPVQIPQLPKEGI